MCTSKYALGSACLPWYALGSAWLLWHSAIRILSDPSLANYGLINYVPAARTPSLKDDPDKRLPKDVEIAMAECVLSMFTSEKREVWISPDCKSRSSAAGRGKILSRYYDIRRKMNKSGLLTKSTSTNEHEDENENIDEELKDNLLWLQNNKQPWTKVNLLWNSTSKHRMRSLVNGTVPVATYLTKYPALQDPSGYLLLSTDFDVKYPNSGMSLFTEWPMLAAFIETIAPKPEDIKESLTEEGRKIRTIHTIPYLFPVITCAKKGKRQWRPSRQESADALMLHVKCIGDISISLANRAKDKYEPYNLSLGPQAIVVGPDLDNVSKSFVRINSTMYEVENPLKALDVTFKAMHALDCKYHKESLREWLFLEKAVYKINADKPEGRITTAWKSYTDFK
ncbi:Ubiquitin carboxyl-terminal hydrolase 1 [Frankliniella fusca]|uniref:Ubiquitin carboxyl-terminal hydrolase 1 n=1 Tax=Frankliniella fusca TaxID=407009 RepID=A0AAE1HVR5_9NEOP|nr:Ubiquitin carboxyl-terminal hydrolase 1 [Frankliniella fusca]